MDAVLQNVELFISTMDQIIPKNSMSQTEIIFASIRLLIIVTVILILFQIHIGNVIIILMGGLLGLLWYKYRSCPPPPENFEISSATALNTGIREFQPGVDSRPQGPDNKACWFDADLGLLNARLELTPPIQFNHYDDAKRSYMNAKYELTPLTDTNGFREIWRNEPEMCGSFTMVPNPETQFPVYDPESTGQCNYIVRSKIDHLPASQSSNGLVSLRAMAEQAFTTSAIDFRNGIMNEHIDRFRRERQHNCADMPLNTASAGSGVAN